MPSVEKQGRFAVVILNWNNPVDTIACVASVIEQEGPPLAIYVVDNGSTDGSPTRINDWLTARTEAFAQADHETRIRRRILGNATVALISLTNNLGYSGGNNAGLQMALADGCSAALVLNNDTVLLQGALLALATRLQSDPTVGVVGAQLVEYEDRTVVQSLGGGRYQWVLSRSRPLSRADVARGSVGSRLAVDYISGACSLFPRSTLETVGLFDERFFLYFEDVDYGIRCMKAGRNIDVCTDAIVAHRYGASTGSSRTMAGRSSTSMFHACRSAVLLTAKHRPILVPWVLAIRLAFAAALLARREFRLSAAAIRGVASGLRFVLAPKNKLKDATSREI